MGILGLEVPLLEYLNFIHSKLTTSILNTHGEIIMDKIKINCGQNRLQAKGFKNDYNHIQQDDPYYEKLYYKIRLILSALMESPFWYRNKPAQRRELVKEWLAYF